MKRGTRQTLPYRLTAVLLFAVGMLMFAVPLAYGSGWWYVLSAVGVVVMFSGYGVVQYAVMRFGPDA